MYESRRSSRADARAVKALRQLKFTTLGLAAKNKTLPILRKVYCFFSRLRLKPKLAMELERANQVLSFCNKEEFEEMLQNYSLICTVRSVSSFAKVSTFVV